MAKDFYYISMKYVSLSRRYIVQYFFFKEITSPVDIMQRQTLVSRQQGINLYFVVGNMSPEPGDEFIYIGGIFYLTSSSLNPRCMPQSN